MNNEQIMEKLRKELMWTRVFSIISCVLMVLVLVGGFLFYNKTQEYEWQLKGYVEEVEEHSEEITAAIVQLSLLDMDVLNETLAETLRAISSVDWQMVSDSIDSVNWEVLSKQLAELDVKAINDAINGLDTEELTQALENMNNAVDRLKKGVEALTALGDKIGSYFK